MLILACYFVLEVLGYCLRLRMDGKLLASRNLVQGKSSGFLNLQEAMQANGKGVPQPFQGLVVSHDAQAQDAFPMRNRGGRKSDIPVSFLDGHGEDDTTKNSCDEDGSYAMGEHVDANNEISYIGEDASSDSGGGGRRISPLLPKKGKWRAISKVMAERGFHVSPQQCEDKFNDLNKRYKKLNDILGRGTSCEVVENPTLLDLMDISAKSKESVRKILSSKQLFYQEMCSYHNGNRLYIPHDQSIQRSLHLALRNSDDLESHESKAYRSDSINDDEEINASENQNDNNEEKHLLHEDLGSTRVPAKRKKQGEPEYLDSDHVMNFIATKKSTPDDHARTSQVPGQGATLDWRRNPWFMSRTLQLEEQKLQIEAEMLELEKQRLRWLRFSELEDRDLEKMRLENEYLKLENERLALEIKRQEMGGHAN
ncbi:hypothetical protein Sango_0932500 [Sesamum angolense]|uniref:Myb/SANT-like DNA-binding domain-containing protein n=1 Tax=Sesamum angolense TaxID=2727404 RepID=A0AAE1WYF0_9LAMI|nr:hypothetical protein Sango_0932500 [Sesamum angolense]